MIRLVDLLVRVHVRPERGRVVALIALVGRHVEMDSIHMFLEQPFSLDSETALVAHVWLLLSPVLAVEPRLVCSHPVIAICCIGTLVALFQLGRPRLQHGEAEELEGVIEGPLPGACSKSQLYLPWH